MGAKCAIRPFHHQDCSDPLAIAGQLRRHLAWNRHALRAARLCLRRLGDGLCLDYLLRLDLISCYTCVFLHWPLPATDTDFRAKILAGIVLSDPRHRSCADIRRKAFGPRFKLIISILFCLELFAVRYVGLRPPWFRN